MNNTTSPDGVAKAAEKLKNKLKREKVSFSNYKLSSKEETQPTSSLTRHQEKPHKVSVYLSDAALKLLDFVYIQRYQENNKISKSMLICEALELLASKQEKKSQGR